MSKILRNDSALDIPIIDTGVTVLATSSYTIPPQDYAAFAASSDVIKLIANLSLTFNDGSSDITNVSNAIDIIKGWCPSPATLTNPFFFDFSDIITGDLPIPLIAYTVTPGQLLNLTNLKIACRIEAFIQVTKNVEIIADLRTGAGSPESSFTWYPNRPCIEGDVITVTLTKRPGTVDISVGAHLMGVTN
jgi:hypothetical protein